MHAAIAEGSSCDNGDLDLCRSGELGHDLSRPVRADVVHYDNLDRFWCGVDLPCQALEGGGYVASLVFGWDDDPHRRINTEVQYRSTHVGIVLLLKRCRPE